MNIIYVYIYYIDTDVPDYSQCILKLKRLQSIHYNKLFHNVLVYWLHHMIYIHLKINRQRWSYDDNDCEVKMPRNTTDKHESKD